MTLLCAGDWPPAVDGPRRVVTLRHRRRAGGTASHRRDGGGGDGDGDGGGSGDGAATVVVEAIAAVAMVVAEAAAVMAVRVAL